jgi:hypothetical protein
MSSQAACWSPTAGTLVATVADGARAPKAEPVTGFSP